MNLTMTNVNNKNFLRSISIILVILLLVTAYGTIFAHNYVAAEYGWDVLIFISGALVGGGIFVAGQWLLTSGAIAALTPAGASAVLVGLGALGLIVAAVHMHQGGDQVNYYVSQAGCVRTPDGQNWICPTKIG